MMRLRAAIAAAVIAVALAIPTNAFAYLTWLEFARQSNSASTLTMAWQYGPGYYGTQVWRAGSGVSTDACWIGHGWLPTGYYDLNGHRTVHRMPATMGGAHRDGAATRDTSRSTATTERTCHDGIDGSTRPDDRPNAEVTRRGRGHARVAAREYRAAHRAGVRSLAHRRQARAQGL